MREISQDGTPRTTARAHSSSVSHRRMVEKRSRARSGPSFSIDSEMIGTAKKICQDTGVSYTNIIVNESLIDLLDGIQAIPTTFIVDSEGNAICEPIIGADVNAYKTAVTEYLEQMEK